MPKIVNKEERRREIALSCKELFIQKGINALTVAEAAKAAKIGKGTIYEYFENKDDIVFEIVEVLMNEHNIKKQEAINNATTTKEKVKVFFDFFYSDDKEKIELRALYKEFVSINLIAPNESMICHGQKCTREYFTWFENILNEGIEKGEIHPNSIKLAKGLFVVGDGTFIANETSKLELDIKKEINDYIDALFEFIEVKK